LLCARRLVDGEWVVASAEAVVANLGDLGFAGAAAVTQHDLTVLGETFETVEAFGVLG